MLFFSSKEKGMNFIAFVFAPKLDEYKIFHFRPLSFNNTFLFHPSIIFLYYDKYPKSSHALRFTSSLNHFFRALGGSSGGGLDEKFHVILQRLCKASSHRCDVMGNFNFPLLVLRNIWQRHRHAPFSTHILA